MPAPACWSEIRSHRRRSSSARARRDGARAAHCDTVTVRSSPTPDRPGLVRRDPRAQVGPAGRRSGDPRRFARTLAVRGGGDARASWPTLWFFETLVRVHRRGRGRAVHRPEARRRRSGPAAGASPTAPLRATAWRRWWGGMTAHVARDCGIGFPRRPSCAARGGRRRGRTGLRGGLTSRFGGTTPSGLHQAALATPGAHGEVPRSPGEAPH